MSSSSRSDSGEATPNNEHAPGTHSRSGRVLAGMLVAGLTVAAVAVTGGQSAGAAESLRAQSVGRLVDGTLGGKPIQQVADVADARATAPGTQSVQNPLNVTLLGQLNVPLSGVIDLPKVGAVSALAQTAVGGAVTPAPQYAIAGLDMTLASPALGGVLTQLAGLLNPAGLPGLPGTPIPLPGATVPTACTVSTAVLAPISVAGGGVSINPTSGVITISLAKLLAFLGADINALPANTDLLAYLLKYLSDPAGLATGLKDVATSITQPGQARLTACLTAISAQNAAGQLALAPLVALINNGSAALQAGIKQLTDALAALPGGSSPFKPLADGLKSVIDIGINVESGPGIQAVQSNPDFVYTTALAKTPNQATPVVADQTLVRALEINLLGTGAVVALANAAVGPSTAAPAAPTTAPTTATPAATNTNIPTGVPAGLATPTGSADLPLILLIIGLLLASGGAVTWKLRGRHAR